MGRSSVPFALVWYSLFQILQLTFSRDVQRRRIFKRFHGEREKLNAVIKSDLLPRELKESAFREKHFKLPIDSSAKRPVFRCTVTGRARGNYNEFRVSRFIFRAEADYNKVSGVQRAFWLYNTHIDPFPKENSKTD